MLSWYSNKRSIEAAPKRSPYARMQSTHTCPACGGPLDTVYQKTNPANWFVACKNCPYKWDAARGNEEAGMPLNPAGVAEAPGPPDVRAYQQQAVQPEAQPEVPPEPEVQPEAPPEPPVDDDPNRPICKMCGQPIDDSRYQRGEHKKYYCLTCHANGFSVSYMNGMVDFKLSRNKQILYQGPYDDWNPDPNNGVQIGAELARIRPIEDRRDDVGDDEVDRGDEVVNEAMLAAEEEYQPEADIMLGNIRLLSTERRNALGVVPDGTPQGRNVLGQTVMTGILNGAEGLDESVRGYTEQQFFAARVAAGEVPDADPLTSPVILDSMAGDPETIAAEIAANPLYPLTEIGGKGLVPNVSQANALKVLAETGKNLIVCFPTGAGKTAIAEAAIASGLMNVPPEGIAPLTLYVCPSRALTSQVARDLSDPEHPFAQQGWRVAMERGQREGEDPNAATEVEGGQRVRLRKGIPKDLAGVPWAENLSESVEEASVMVIVPERLLTCLMAPDKYQWVHRITTMIFDEGHLIGEDDRGPKFEGQQIYLYRNYYRQIRATEIGARARIVFMSATMENALELASWQNRMTGGNVEWSVAWGEYRPVPLEVEFEQFLAEGEDAEENLALQMLEETLAEENQADYVDPATQRVSRVQLPTLHFVHVLRHGYMLQKTARRRYRQCPRCDFIFPAERLPEDVNKFRRAEDTICQRCRNFPVEEWDVGFYHAHVPAADQEAMVKDFNSGRTRTLIASPALAAGVNLQAMRQFQWDMMRAGRDVDTSVVRQMIGRTGRQSFAVQYPDQPGRIKVFVRADKALHHQRRLNAGAYLESHFANPLKVTDNVLRGVMMGGIQNWGQCGEYMSSSLAYFQANVDRNDPLNVRRALEAIANSASEGGGENDKIVWVREGEPIEGGCLHPDVTVDGEAVADMNEVWPVVCKVCGAGGELRPTAEARGDEVFGQVAEDGIRDLVAAGLLIMDEQGNLRVTRLGSEIVMSHMDSSSAIDLMRNASIYNVTTANPLQLAYVFGRLRVNDDPEIGRYITEEQAAECPEALSILGQTAEAATPAAKMVQCIFWSLMGIPYDEVPDCLKQDYLAVGDEYGGTFMRGFQAISSRAMWFENDRKRLETIKVQLKKQVPPDAAKFAVVEGIRSDEAWALQRAGFADLFDVMRAPVSDIRWGDYFWYRYRMDKMQNPPIRNLPSSVARDLEAPIIKQQERIRYRRAARYIKDIARVGLDGLSGGRWIKRKKESREGRVYFVLEYVGGIPDPAYRSSVLTLNEQEAALAVEGGEPVGGEQAAEI
jgi:hypothetical protein